MASRRLLKKEIKGLYAESVKAFWKALIMTKMSKQSLAEEVGNDIETLYTDFLVRISHTEPNNAKEYYRIFHKELSGRLDKIAQGLEDMIKE